MSTTKGERIWRILLNPASKDIAASEWLLLFTIFKNRNICLKDIGKKVAENWEKVHKNNPDFYIMWSTGYDIAKELIRYEDIGILQITKWKDEEHCWDITEKGNEVLKNWKDKVKEILGPFAQSVG